MRLVGVIIDECPKVVLTPRHIRELQPHLRRAGFRFPAQQVEPLRALDAAGKLVQPPASGIRSLTSAEAKVLKARGHRDISDDRHLVEAARSYDRLLVTNDPNIASRRRDIARHFGVEVLDVAEAIRDAD